MRLLICAGGTGGGVYPALAVLQSLVSGGNGWTSLWVGGIGGMEADLVKRANVPYAAIPAAGVAGVGARALPGNLWKLGRGFFAARRVLSQFRPDALLFTGGYLAVPMALAAQAPGRGFPRPRVLLYVPDIEPGLALKTLARFADHIGMTAEDTRPFIPRGKAATVTGYPVRKELKPLDKGNARRVLELSDDLPVLLVSGGSSGARSINKAVWSILPDLLAQAQVVHLTGRLSWEEAQQQPGKLSPDLAERYHVYPYLHEELAAALSAADLTLTRAGASTLGELPLFGLPAVLVPYPYAWRYQIVNARYLADRGAAAVLEDGFLSTQLLPLVGELLSDQQKLAGMRHAMKKLSHPGAAGDLAAILRSLTAGHAPEGRQTWSA